ncbi:Similar to Mitochondrial import inner membrane translocase subunit tim54; acc. no. Q2UJY4 [Pyronema omphalodes CBS 100304]|uniref:Mitochondrial import inner membrane translocase subunit TIM54 n=1 Tax=Pyronema omphalodes (strain CBS 100304) TaxID=1076935 RepID=U4LEZ2_PYROM|nr:Similar to Mitochondrial import inner membrane translocase subunit tim54; acc. no. Q2UJY4 [Pyronema omphalodes CBS 100304]
MSEPTTTPAASSAAPATSAAATAAKAVPKQNPALAAMGLPKLRAKLPSRNWTVFLTLCTAIGGSVYYDRHHTNKTKQKWINLVSHLAERPLAPMELPRKVTVYLCAPPGDSLQVAREHFRDYIKPVLNAAAVDFDVVEGKKMGELRHKVAENIRKERRGDPKGPVEEVRERNGITYKEEGGVVVVGRVAWKEYLRGLQEGWLGPLEAPPSEEKPIPEAAAPVVEGIDALVAEKTEAEIKEEAKKTEEDKKKADEEAARKKNAIPEPLLRVEDFEKAELPKSMPTVFEPAAVISFPHILGFLNTPTRMVRYFNKRKMADEVCREAAAVALGINRPFITEPEPAGTMSAPEEVEEGLKATKVLGEVDALAHEEKDWLKKVWEEEKYQGGEWPSPITVDSRILSRLRKFYIPTDMEPKEEPKDAWGL